MLQSSKANINNIMAEENPWKKQLQANKANGPPSQIKKDPPPNNTPPWMKKKEETGDTSSLAPWMKKPQTTSTAPNTSTIPPPTSSPPPWQKKNDQPATSPSTSNPPWMKGNNPPNSNAPSNSSSPPWKAGQNNAAELQKQKKLEEEKQRLLRQEQERKAEEERQRLIKQKQQQLKNEQRQNKLMRIEQQISIARQKQEKLQRQRQQADSKKKAGKSPKKKEAKKKKEPSSNSKIEERQQSESDTIFQSYLSYLSEQISFADYTSKIDIQTKIIQLHNKFISESSDFIVDFLKDKKLSNRKRRFIYANNLQLEYALCQGKTVDQKVEFDMEKIYKLQEKFSLYNQIHKIVLALLKKQAKFKLRAPLMAYISYKGIEFISQALCPELNDVIASDCIYYSEINNEIQLLQKQLKQISVSITKQDLMVKKIVLNSQEFYVLYLKEQKTTASSPSKRDPSKQSIVRSSIIQRSPQQEKESLSRINDLQLLEMIYSKTCPYHFHQPETESADKLGSQHIHSIHSIINLATAINTVYASCQGEVNEESFFKLILQGNKEIWDMIATAGYSSQNRNLEGKAIVFAYLQSISCIKFNLKDNFFSSKRKQLIRSIKPLAKSYRYSSFEIIQFCNNLQKYIRQGKGQLAEQSLSMSEQLLKKGQEIKTQSQEQFDVLHIKNRVNYLLFEKKKNEALELLTQISSKLASKDFKHIAIKLLFIQIYVLIDAEMELLVKLSELLSLLEFFFEYETVIHSQVYSIIGSYYSKKDNSEDKVIQFYSHAFNIAMKIHGDKTTEIADLYLSRGESFANIKNYDLFGKDISTALRIYKSSSKNNKKIADCYFLMGKVKCASISSKKEGLELIQSAASLYIKIEHYLQALNVRFALLEYYQEESDQQRTLDSILSLCLTYKSYRYLKRALTEALQRELRAYPQLSLAQLQDIEAEWMDEQEEDLGDEQILIGLEEGLNGFGSILDIIKWAIGVIIAKMTKREIANEYERAKKIIGQAMYFYQTEAPDELPKEEVDSQKDGQIQKEGEIASEASPIKNMESIGDQSVQIQNQEN